jgi:hypothetical protein
VDLHDEAWVRLLGADPRPRLLSGEETTARWIALTSLLDGAQSAVVDEARAAVLADPLTEVVLSRIPDWEHDLVRGHSVPSYGPTVLGMLADIGVQAGDDVRIHRLLDQMLAHQEGSGRFAGLGKFPMSDFSGWGVVLCDSHAVVETLVRFGRAADPRTRDGIARMAADLSETPQGPGWRCEPHSVTGWRGPGRKDDVCPQVTLEALRTFARLPEDERPSGLTEAARTMLGLWRQRSSQKPYMFGHGRTFKTVKWPAAWYHVHMVLDTLGRYPELWRGRQADPADRRALAELAACLIDYNFDATGMVTPLSCYRGWEELSLGQKKRPSCWATAQLCAALRRLDDLADDISSVDVLRLASSKGGSGTPLPPRFPRP